MEPRTTTVELNTLQVYVLSRASSTLYNLIQMGLVNGDTYELGMLEVGLVQVFDKLEGATLDLQTQHRKEKL